MIKLEGTQKYLEALDNPNAQEFLQWCQIQWYKNIDIATILSGSATIASGVVYLLFKSFTDILK